jgi:hypothetical protein
VTSRDQPCAVLNATIRTGSVILTVEQVSDQRRSVGLRIVRLTPSPAERTEIIEHNIDIAIGFFGHNRR